MALFDILYRWLYTKVILAKLIKLFGLFSGLRATTNDSYENIISRTCYYAWYVLTRRIDSNYPDVQKQVLHSEPVQNAIQRAAQEEYRQQHGHEYSGQNDFAFQLLLERHRQTAFHHLMRLRSCISTSLMRIAGWVLYRLLSRIFTSIQFNKNHIENIQKCIDQSEKEKIPIIYLPLHRSHLDYILISFILYMNNIKPPLVAAGDNLMIPFFGNLLRGLGAFFIKRRADSNHPQEQIYQALLKAYITENLRVGNSIEFFIEGGRTRSGKIASPKYGLLSIAVDVLLQGAVKNVYIVPVSIAYEKLVDGTFVEENLGTPKQFENFRIVAKAIWSTLHSNYGIVRVDFGKPFLLKEYLYQVIEKNATFNTLKNDLSNQQTLSDSVAHKCVACEGAMSTSDVNVQQDYVLSDKLQVVQTRRRCIESLAKHVLYDAYKESAIMSTHLVAFLLLNKYRTGVTMDQLANDLDWLRETLHHEKDQSLSAFGNCDDVVRQAMFYLGKELITTEKVSMKWSTWRSTLPYGNKSYSRFKNNYQRSYQQRKSNNTGGRMEQDCDKIGDTNSHIEIIYFKPVLKLQSALQLHYYANSCVSLFQLESVLATALFSYINVDIGSLIFDPTTYISNLAIDKNEFLQRCKQICSILQFEFHFNKMCQPLDETLDMAFDLFVSKNIFVQSRSYRNSRSSELNYTRNFSIGNRYNLEVIDEEESFDEEEYDNQPEGVSIAALECSPTNSQQTAAIGSNRPATNGGGEFRLLLTSRNCQLLNFYRAILAPYIESYSLTAERLTTFLTNQKVTTTNKFPVVIKENVFLKELSLSLQQMLINGQIQHEESISYNTFRNSLKYLHMVRAIKRIETIPRNKQVPKRNVGGWCSKRSVINNNGSSVTLSVTGTSSSLSSSKIRHPVVAGTHKTSQVTETCIQFIMNAEQMKQVVDSLRIYAIHNVNDNQR